MADKKKDESKGEKKNWYSDRYQRVVVQRNTLALVTVLALLCSIAATFSISQLVPLKSVEPFVIQVDEKSGVTQVVDPIKAKELSGKESINQYFMVQYIRARESYLGSLDRNYYNANLVRVLSEPEVYRKYQSEVSPSNPESPAATLKSSFREVKITSIKPLDTHALSGGEESRRYLVRVQVAEKAEGVSQKSVQKLILIEFKYTALDLSIEDRYLNPIGFLVLSYRIDDDNISN